MGSKPNWTREEKQYLEDNWGNLSIETLCKNLGRSKNGIICMKNRLGLGSFLTNGDYVSWNEIKKSLGMSYSGTYMNTSWIEKRKFPIHTRKVGNTSFRIVYLDEFWKWAEDNKDILDFSKMEELVFGAEPKWVKQKRDEDIWKRQMFKMIPWTKDEDAKLKKLVGEYKYSYKELSKMLHRTEGAIARRLIDLKVKDRPIKADNHTKWTKQEIDLLQDLIMQGCKYEIIARHIDKSVKAIRYKVYVLYGSENLDKVRTRMRG